MTSEHGLVDVYLRLLCCLCCILIVAIEVVRELTRFWHSRPPSNSVLYHFVDLQELIPIYRSLEGDLSDNVRRAGQWRVVVRAVCRCWLIVCWFVLVGCCKRILLLLASWVCCFCMLCLKVWVVILTLIVWVVHMYLANLFRLQYRLGLDYLHLVC